MDFGKVRSGVFLSDAEYASSSSRHGSGLQRAPDSRTIFTLSAKYIRPST